MTRIGAGAFLVMLFCASTARAQSRIEWSVRFDLTAADRAAIVKLAGKLRVENPAKVWQPHGGLCPLLFVDSGRVVDGHRVVWTTVYVRQKTGPGCGPVTSVVGVVEIGNWIVFPNASNPSRNEQWRVRDGDWFVDFWHGADAVYEDVEKVVLALRRGRLVDRRAPEPLPPSPLPVPLPSPLPPLPAIDVNRITSIARGEKHFGFGPEGGYEVRTGDHAGDVLLVRIAGDDAEIHEAVSWIE